MCYNAAMTRPNSFPFTHNDVIQHVSKAGDRFVIRIVDNEVYEAYAENLDDHLRGTRIINPANWVKIGVLVNGKLSAC